MKLDFQNSNLYEMNRYNNKNYCCIINSNLLNCNKFYFTKDSNITISRLTNFFINDSKIRKITNYHKSFDNNYFIYFNNFDLENNLTYAIPLFECKEFKCLSCNKIHNSKSMKCCSFSSSVISIQQASLNSLYLCKNEDFLKTLEIVKEEFIKLHFPDVLDKILLV